MSFPPFVETPENKQYRNTSRSSPPCEVNPTPNESFRRAICPCDEMIAAQQKSHADQERGLSVLRCSRRSVLAPLDLGDLVGLGAARRHHFHRHALLLADQRARQRRGDGTPALL